MSWASKRQFKIIGLLLLIPLCIVVYFVYSFLTVKPTCFDSKMNGQEQGIDCGGTCRLQCTEYMQEIAIKWARSFQITKNLYNAAAYVENQNTRVGIEKINYQFKLYDKDRLLIAHREGQTFIEPNKGKVIFEEQIQVGNIEPVYTNFVFTSTPVWYTTDSRFSELVFQVKDKKLNTEDIKPRFSSVLKNVSEKYPIDNVEVVVVLFNELGNAIQVGKTLLGNVPPLAEKNIFITWQNQFTETPVSFEVYPQFSPFTQEFDK